MAGLADYMARYDHEHSSAWNRVLHGIGIPILFASLASLLLTHWLLGIALFIAGWILLFLGHHIEGNRPAFFQGPIYFLVGPLWVAKEIKDALLGSRRAQTPAPR
jgi:uncharacterized membrane protein YGL010W